ncbi:MAG: ABC transporter permease [Clostridia bacterium]|nr:ABC transporter permease [Clostridia bacterium]
MRESVSRIRTLCGRNLKEILRDPISLLFMIALPLFMEILFYFIFRNLTSQFEMKYLAPGIVVFSQAFLTLFTGLLIALDRGSSFLTRLYVSRARPFEFILGYALAVVPVAAVQSVLFFLAGGILDPSIFCVRMIPAALLSVVTSLLFIAFGILFGSLCNEKAIGGVSSIVITGQSVLSGMWFPTEGLSGGFLTVMNVLPFKNALLTVQYMLNGEGEVWKPLLITLAYTVAIFVAAVLVFRSRMRAD